jgi:hypothetical protein
MRAIYSLSTVLILSLSFLTQAYSHQHDSPYHLARREAEAEAEAYYDILDELDLYERDITDGGYGDHQHFALHARSCPGRHCWEWYPKHDLATGKTPALCKYCNEKCRD